MNTCRLFLFLLLPCFAFSQHVIINEIMASNQTTIRDEDGDAPDYIELYNSGAGPVQLEGYGLSDDPATRKWRFGSAVLAPGEYLIVFASDKNRKTTNWHTNFKISASGETIVLTDAAGTVLDRVDLPVLGADLSYGRSSDGSMSWMVQTPSPGVKNTGSVTKPFSDPVTISLAAGFYSSAVTVELSAGSSTVYYTLDGSDPDSASTVYTKPIIIETTSVLKANSLKENHQPSPIIHRTYLIDENTTLPVISLSSDPYNLFDYNYGIYANGPGWTPTAPNHGANFWMDWERPAHVEFFADDKSLGFSEACGIAIYGAYTRSYPQKSFSVKFKSDYGVSEIHYPLFPDIDVTTFKSFILRNSGNDFYYTHFRDAMMQNLVKDLDIDYLEYRPATTFLNGQYWGIYNIREKISEHYVANRHGVDPDNIDMLEGNMEVIHGDTHHYQKLIDYISTQNMATDDAYAFINRMIDLDECLLYFAAEVYYNSQDWPANNIKYWRERSETGKWRWILFDLDFGFNLYETNGQAENHLTYLLSGIETRPGSNPPWSTLLSRKLVQNPTVKNRFINLIADLLNTNFKSTRVVSIINQMAAHLANDIGRHRKHWGISEQTAASHINRMISFAQERPTYLRGFVNDYFKCGGNAKITINCTAGGRIKLNSIFLLPGEMPWSGIYFQNNPVHLQAIPDSGYRFDGWSGAVASVDSALTLLIGRTATISASFSALSSSTVDMDSHGNIPERLELYQNYPNPFNPTTTIEFALPKAESVTLYIYDLLGREVATLVSERLAAGIHAFKWDASGLAGGVYFYRLQAGNFVQSKKLVLMR
jgi:hypothetical protein